MDPDAIGMVSGVGRGIGVVDGDGYHRREGNSFGGEFGHPRRPIVTNGDFVTRLFPNYFGLYLFANLECSCRFVVHCNCGLIM